MISIKGIIGLWEEKQCKEWEQTITIWYKKSLIFSAGKAQVPLIVHTDTEMEGEENTMHWLSEDSSLIYILLKVIMMMV